MSDRDDRMAIEEVLTELADFTSQLSASDSVMASVVRLRQCNPDLFFNVGIAPDFTQDVLGGLRDIQRTVKNLRKKYILSHRSLRIDCTGADPNEVETMISDLIWGSQSTESGETKPATRIMSEAEAIFRFPDEYF